MQDRANPLARLATAQHGVVARRQLLEMGWGRGAIETGLSKGVLMPLHGGVYAVGHTRLSLRGRWMAAVLACGPEAVLSHHAAAALWELAPAPQGLIDVTAPTSRSRRGIRSHRSRPGSAERTVRDGIPVTTPERTLLDYAEVSDRRRLLRALEAGERSQVVNFRRLQAVVASADGRRGVRPLRAALAEMDPEAPWVHEGLEEALRELIRKAGLPMPSFNVLVEGELVDVVWLERRVVVEADSWGFHRSRRAFEADRRRDAKLQALGWRVVRITHERVTGDQPAVISTLRRLIGSAPP